MRSRHTLPNIRIAVVGAGAIGSYYGGKLAHFGRDVHFLMRSDYEVVRKRGLRIRSKGGNIHIAKINAYRSTEEIGPCDLVIVAVKASVNAQLPPLVRPLLGEKTMILTLQNGLGNEEFLAQHFGAERILGGLCFICLNRIEPGVIELHDNGRVALGEFSGFPRPRLHDLAWEFKRCGVVCSVVADLALEHWRKLVWNIPFNGLTIIAGGIDTAAILANDPLRLLALELMDETVAIANACGHALPTAVALDQLKRTETMGAYKPSTLMDYLAGRPLEIEAIWGEPLRRGLAAGVRTPQLEKLHRQLVALDQAQRR
ncbi:MAG: 2-dehydropantoate 2-reductase [Chthoniobacterales bacterium]|jgi:2-dehydropantoate 2-reductase|nr:2-dehydropantoate 2-reductase [Chthoniobacterales bacterium]